MKIWGFPEKFFTVTHIFFNFMEIVVNHRAQKIAMSSHLLESYVWTMVTCSVLRGTKLLILGMCEVALK